jgi:hypothetical protein
LHKTHGFMTFFFIAMAGEKKMIEAICKIS